MNMRGKVAVLVTTVVVALSMSACDLDSSSAAQGGNHKANKDKGDATPADSPSKSKPPKPNFTTAQENAIRSAQQYLNLGSGFSRAGLIQQLSSPAGEGFKLADAVFAVNHIKVDYNKQAVLSAKGYLSISGFSRSGLIQQLTAKAGDGYTLAQATYAANHVGL